MRLFHHSTTALRNIFFAYCRRFMAAQTTTPSPLPPAERQQPPPGFNTLTEGKATILYKGSNEVFYNPAQQVNRDLSVAALRVFVKMRNNEIAEATRKKAKETDLSGKTPTDPSGAASATLSSSDENGITILEALSATGLRAIRYFKEVPGIKYVVANDADEAAVQSIQRNVAFNGLDAATQVLPNKGDAIAVLHAHRAEQARFDVIDLDPYGSPVEFLDGAVQALREGGLLCVTATDMAVLCGNHSEKCYAKYSAMSLRGVHCHEMALRIATATIASTAARHGRYIVPLLAVSMDFYIRLFIRVYSSPAEVKFLPSRLAYVFQCSGCGTYAFQPVGKAVRSGRGAKFAPPPAPPVGRACEFCNRNHVLGGPIWHRPLHEPQFVTEVLQQVLQQPQDFAAHKKLAGTLASVADECAIDAAVSKLGTEHHDVESPGMPLYISLDALCNTLHLEPISKLKFTSALGQAGYKVAATHASAKGLKTTAPFAVVWDIMRLWAKQRPPKPPSLTSPAHAILSVEPGHAVTVPIDFNAPVPTHAVLQPVVPIAGLANIPRYIPNPEEWGPKARATGKKRTRDSGADEEDAEGDEAPIETLAERRARNQNKRAKRRKQQQEPEQPPTAGPANSPKE